MSDKLNREIQDFSPEEKRALLAQLLKEKATQSKKESPLSYGQRALWFIHQLDPESSAYHVASTSRITSTVDVAALKRATQYLVNRHPTLRTTYEQRGDQLIQVIHGHQDVYFEQVDASAWDEKELQSQIILNHKRPIDLLNGPVIRWVLFTKSASDHVLLITVHHIGFDGYSMIVLLQDLRSAYEAEASGKPPSLPPLKVSYIDFVDRQVSLLASDKGQQLKSYWMNQLSGDLPVINLLSDFPRPIVQTYNGDSVEISIDAETTNRLKQLAMAEGVTLYVLLLSIFQAQMHRYTGQNDLVIGSPNSTRDITEFGGVTGYFVDPLVLRSTIESETTFKTLLKHTRRTVLDALAHQGYPFMLIVQDLGIKNDPSRSPLFQVAFNLQSLQRIENTSLLVQKDINNPNLLTTEPFFISQEEGQFDLALDIVEVGGRLWCAFKFNTDLYEKATITRMASHYQTLIEAVLTNSEIPLARLALLPENERHQLLVEWNQTDVDFPKDRCVHELFEAQVVRTPHAVAVQFEDQTLTYDQLNRRANQLAYYLRKLGVGPDEKVGIYIERSLDMMIALYAIHKAGGAYVPLDPTYPEDRIAFMLEDSRVSVLLTQEHLLQRIPTNEAKKVCISRDWATISQESDTNPTHNTRPHHLCYMIYTSGSTGKPKGVMIEHRNVVNFFTGMDAVIPYDNAGIWLAVTSTSFDISVLELFWTLSRGFTVVLYGDNQANTAADYSISALINRHQVTHMQCTPAMADMLLMAPDSASALGSLETLLVGGEALAVTLGIRLRERVQKHLINMYGPTETTIWSSTFRVENSQQTIPIGKPIANTRLYILDGQLQPLPIGIPGELYIGGAGVVRGYWNRPELTQERFIADPFNKHENNRLYRTGDLARYLPDGNIDFLGRNDFRVKIRGHRIELGEIETLLDQHPSVQKAVVIAREDVQGDKQLVAYVMQQHDARAEATDLRTYLRDILPEYMVPAAFVTLDAFPLTPNQKVDRKALPAPDVQVRSEIIDSQNLPSKPMEVLIANIWRDILKVDTISIYDNFFDLGGHSLQVMQVVTKLESETGLKINPVTMRMQTLGQLASACEAQALNPPPQQSETTRPQQKLFSTIKRFVTGKQDKG